MKVVYNLVETFLNDVFAHSGLELRATVNSSENHSLLLNIDGADAALLRGGGGEFLDALEHLLNQSFLRELSAEERILCDVHGFRAVRESELRAMAHHAAEQVRLTSRPFIFGHMNSSERRIIHLYLANESDIYSESIGQGSERRLKVSLKHCAK